jgi:hypothetical protein
VRIDPAAAGGFVPSSISCPTPTFCEALNGRDNAIRYNGSGWSAPVSVDHGAFEFRLSCPSASFCLAVDSVNRALTYDGSSWSAPSAQVESRSFISGLSCPNAGFCIAVDSVGYALTYTSPPPPAPPPPPPTGTPPTAPANTALPAVTGQTVAGQTLTASPGAWSGTAPVTYAYQWQLCKPGCADIAGQTASTLTLGAADAGARVAVLITASNAAGSATASSPQVGTVSSASAAQARAALLKALRVFGKNATLSQLLKHGGYTLTFDAPGAGHLSVGWYLVPKSAHLTAAKHRPKPVLVANVSVRITRTGNVKVKVKLTVKGKTLLRDGGRPKLSAKGTFTPVGGSATTVIRPITV